MSRKPAQDPLARPHDARKQIVRLMELSRNEKAPVKPGTRHTHPRTGRIALIGSFDRGVPPFIRNVHSFLAEQALSAGFSFQLSAGSELRELERAEGILITDPLWLTPEREAELRGSRRGFVTLTAKQPGPNTVFLDASGAWIEFLLSAEQHKTTRVLFMQTNAGEVIPGLTLPASLRSTFPGKRKLPLFQEIPKDIERPDSTLPPDLMTDDTCFLTDDADTAVALSVLEKDPQKNSSRAKDGCFWTACMLPAWDAPQLRYCSFLADPENTAREMLRVLYRQMATGNTSDPGAILQVLWSGRRLSA